MWVEIGKRLLKVYAVLWLTAVGGFLGANLVGIVGLVGLGDQSADQLRWWTHGGWYAGSILFLFGAVTGQLKFINGSSLSRRGLATPSSNQKAKSESCSDLGNGSVQKDNAKSSNATVARGKPLKKSGIISSAFSLGLIGGLLGAFVGGSFLMFWFSLAYSPFATDRNASNTKVVRERSFASSEPQLVHQSGNSTAKYLVAVPVILGVSVGALAGGVGAALGKVHDLE